SIGAVTGGALYMPAIWALFSQKQNGRSILWITTISLVINLFFKFVAPWLLDLRLGRSAEMLVGVGIPFFLLLLYELYGTSTRQGIHSELSIDDTQQDRAPAQVQNVYGMKRSEERRVGIDRLARVTPVHYVHQV